MHLPLRSLFVILSVAFSDCSKRFFSNNRTSRDLDPASYKRGKIGQVGWSRISYRKTTLDYEVSVTQLVGKNSGVDVAQSKLQTLCTYIYIYLLVQQLDVSSLDTTFPPCFPMQTTDQLEIRVFKCSINNLLHLFVFRHVALSCCSFYETPCFSIAESMDKLHQLQKPTL